MLKSISAFVFVRSREGCPLLGGSVKRGSTVLNHPLHVYVRTITSDLCRICRVVLHNVQYIPVPSLHSELTVKQPFRVSGMARGQQKIQAQQKSAAKQAKQRKGGQDQKAAAQKALVYTCPVCRSQMPDPKTYKQHFESKHPKQPLPAELQDK